LEGHDFSAWRAEHERGDRPSGLPYGLEWLERADVDLRHADLTYRDDPVGRLLRSRDSSLPYGLRYQGALGQVATSLPLIARSDVCLSIFEHHADVYRRVRAIARRILPPLVLVSCYLAQWLQHGSPAPRRRAVGIARSAQAITVFSSNQVAILTELAGIAPDRIVVVPYGIDTDFYTPGIGAGHPSPGYVLAVGKDAGRDWGTFLAAAAQTPQIPYRLATASWMLEGLTVPPNVDFVGEVDHRTYRQLLRDSELVVLPTHDYAYPTGQSVLLEAMACGQPTIVANTSAMSDYVTPAVRTYELADAADLSRAVADLWQQRATRPARLADWRPRASRPRRCGPRCFPSSPPAGSGARDPRPASQPDARAPPGVIDVEI